MATRVGQICGVTLGAFLSIKSLQTISKHRKTVLFAKNEQDELQLVHVQVAFRHGARTPIFSIPAMNDSSCGNTVWDKNVLLGDLSHTAIQYRVKSVDGGRKPDSSYDIKQTKLIWPGGSQAGVLTKVGQQQMYELGQELHRRYIKNVEFLQPKMDPHQIYVRTSNVQRTIDSARCVIAGLYGNDNVQGVVTMVTQDEKDETIYPNGRYCGQIKRWVKTAMNLDFFASTHENYKKDWLFLKEELGIKAEKYIFVAFFDNVAAQEAHNLPVSPALLKHKDIIEKHAFEELLFVQCGYPSGRHEVLRLGVGKTLETFVDRMKDKINQKSPCHHKLCMYSVHDTTLVCLLVALGLPNEKWPPYASDLTFELYMNKSQEYFVKVLLRGKEQVLPGVNSILCPFEKFIKLVTPYSVEDWHEECSKIPH